MPALPESTEDRALMTGGFSEDPIYRFVADVLTDRQARGVLLDVGCGVGNLRRFLGPEIQRYVGADIIRYPSFPVEVEFHKIDLDSGRVPLADGSIDIVASVETIEHLENPRAFARELTRLCRPGGWLLITTPNQLSFLSKLTLLLKNRFSAFNDACYPKHITALLEVDLLRIARECGWAEAAVVFSVNGRIPGTALQWPTFLTRLFPRALSDCACLIGRKA